MGDNLPGHLYGTYRTYKADTNFCAQWLIENAKLAGYDVASCVNRQQGKDGSTSRQILPTQQFQLLASFIAQQKPKTQVPAEFMRRLRDAISARRTCAAWHHGSEDSAVKECNDTHKHFIEILEYVMNLFMPLHQSQLRPRKTKARPETPQSSPATTASPNVFDALTAQTAKINLRENTSITALDDPRVFAVDPTGGSQSKSNIEVLLEEPSFDAAGTRFFALHCLMTDLHRLRAYHMSLWKGHAEGETSLMIASVMTNTIIDFASRLVTEFWDDTNTAEPHVYTLMNYFVGWLKGTEESLRFGDSVKPFRNLPEDSADCTRADCDPADFMFLWAWTHVHVFLTKVNKQWWNLDRTLQAEAGSTAPEVARSTTDGPSHSCDYSAREDYQHVREDVRLASEELLAISQRTGIIIIQEDRISLLHNAFGTALGVPCRAVDHHPTIEDQILRLLRSSLRRGRTELLVSFAVQLFFDVSEILPSSNQASQLQELDASLRTVVLKAKLHTAYWSKIGPWWFRVRDLPTERRPQVWYTMNMSISQHVLENKSCHKLWLELQADVRGLLAYSPIAQGIHQFCITSALAVGTSLEADYIGIVQSFIHFYNACRQLGTIGVQ